MSSSIVAAPRVSESNNSSSSMENIKKAHQFNAKYGHVRTHMTSKSSSIVPHSDKTDYATNGIRTAFCAQRLSQ